MRQVDVYLSLGSNLGDRRGNILAAISMLDAALGESHAAMSSIIETEPWGFRAEEDEGRSVENFLNCVVLYRIPRGRGSAGQEALRLLDTCKGIEAALGRTDAPEYDGEGNRVYHSRTIDIDILFFGSEKIDCERDGYVGQRLVIPHLGLRERPFVMVPLAEVACPSLREAFPEIFA